MPVSRVSCRYPGPRESVHIKLLVSPVSFSHNNVRLLMVYWGERERAPSASCGLNGRAVTIDISRYIIGASVSEPPLVDSTDALSCTISR